MKRIDRSSQSPFKENMDYSRNNMKYYDSCVHFTLTGLLKQLIVFYLVLLVCGRGSCYQTYQKNLIFSFRCKYMHCFRKVAPQSIFDYDYTYISFGTESENSFRLDRLDNNNVINYASFSGIIRTTLGDGQINLRLAKLDSNCYVNVVIFFNSTTPTIYQNKVCCSGLVHDAPLSSSETPRGSMDEMQLLEYQELQEITKRFKANHDYDHYVHLNYTVWFESNDMFMISKGLDIHFMINNYFASNQIFPGIQLVLEYVVATDPGSHLLQQYDVINVTHTFKELAGYLKPTLSKPVLVGLYMTEKKMIMVAHGTLKGAAKVKELYLEDKGTVLISTYKMDLTSNEPSPFFSHPVLDSVTIFAHELLHLLGATHVTGRESLMNPVFGNGFLFHISPMTQRNLFEIYEAQCLNRVKDRPHVCSLFPSHY